MIVGVHPLAGFDKVLHYRVPEALWGEVALGSLVRVSVGRRTCLGIVGETRGDSPVPGLVLKDILQCVHAFPALTPDLLKLARWMAGYYGCNLDQVIETMLPAAVRKGAAWKQEKLLALGSPPTPEEFERIRKRAPQQAKLLEFLKVQLKPLSKSLVLRRLGISAAVAKAVVDKGWIRESAQRVERVAYSDEVARAEQVAHPPHDLNSEQAAACSRLAASLAEGHFGVTLLFGVTGSGKTEVYLRAIQEVLEKGGGVVFLVPEVALTPQTVARLRARLEAIAPGHRAVVWHSHLSEGERLDGWYALASGEARVVVGARSAVFAPVQDLRLVVVDEEHEPAYKQDETPRYHGRDVAVMRAKLADAVCVLGSATPSLETFANANSGKYKLVQLTQRVDDRKLPHLEIVDMRIEIARSRGITTLSRRLVDAIHLRLERREQTILFLNRRGYSSSMQCVACGHVETCEHCSIAMTYHRTDEMLRCHLCGSERPAPYACPSCRSPKIRWKGSGTQRVEEAVHRIAPRARVERVDADTMSKKNRFRDILGRFREGKIDILVGTQMIAKGLDFPNVTLVGLVDADISMHVPDFRANERTFQLLVQVAGRAGRGDKSGEVVVQTFTPQSETIQFSRHADFPGFAAAELEMRRAFQYPPYRHLIHHLFRGPNPDKIRFFSEQWAKRVESALAGLVEMRGPSPAPIEKIQDNYRWQLWYFTNQVSRVVQTLAKMRSEFEWPDDVIEVLDVDPMSLC
ncbi:MAG: primosomal protein N' [Opitutaceae bacterium]|nr:primosomal protein N' [Opitutaceae bacterium]